MGPGNGWTGRTTRRASSECVRPRGSAPPSSAHHPSLAGPEGRGSMVGLRIAPSRLCPSIFGPSSQPGRSRGPGVHGWARGLRLWGPRLSGLFRNWAPEQPDDWYGHGLGGGEDCAHITVDGRWNDDVCPRPYRWVCEAQRDGGNDS